MIVCDRQSITLITAPRHQAQPPHPWVSPHVDPKRTMIRTPGIPDRAIYVCQAAIRRQCRTTDPGTLPFPVGTENFPSVEVVLRSTARHHLPARAARSVTLSDNRQVTCSGHNAMLQSTSAPHESS
jgi:hypothetical protein